MKVTIDAGHGGSDPGAVGVGKRQEKDDTLKMAKALKAEMEKRGHQVVMTRTADVLPNPRYAARYNLANNQKADVFVSLHRNSADTPTATGSETLYVTKGVKNAANNAKSKALAETLAGNIAAATGFRNRGAKAQNTNTAVLQNTTMPAVTVEAGFVSHNPTDGSESDNARFDRTFNPMISAIADGLEKHFGKGNGSSSAATSPPASSSSSGVAPDKTGRPVPVPAYFTNGGLAKDRGKPYSNDPNTRWVQEQLYYHHALPADQIDGKFGPKTTAAVKTFQQARINEGRDCGCSKGSNGKQVPDGIVGKKTAAILAE